MFRNFSRLYHRPILSLPNLSWNTLRWIQLNQIQSRGFSNFVIFSEFNRIVAVSSRNSASTRGIRLSTQNKSQVNDGKSPPETNNEQKQSDVTSMNDSLKLIESSGAGVSVDLAITTYKDLVKKRGLHISEVPVLLLVNSLLKANRIDKAKQEVSEITDNKLTASLESNDILQSIFVTVGDTLDPSDLQWFVDNLIFTRQRVDRKVFEQIIRNYLKHQDLDAALDVFKRIAEKFRMTPYMQSITCELIEKMDVDRLEEVLHISTNIHGKSNSFHNMAVSFAICNQIEPAQKIFTSINSENRQFLLENTVDNFKNRRQSKNLHNLLAATVDCASKETRQKMYVALLEIYSNEKATDSIANIISAMEKEAIIPTEDVAKLTKLLNRNDIEVPESWISKPEDGSKQSQLESLLHANKLDEANQMLVDSFKMEEPLERSVIRFCMSKNAEAGNIDFFKKLRSKLDAKTRIMLRFDYYEGDAYCGSGKGAEYVQHIRKVMKENPKNVRNVGSSITDRVIELMEKDAAFYNSFKNLAITFAYNGAVKPACVVWTFNFIHDKNKADNEILWQKYLRVHPTITCSVVTKILFQRKQTAKLRAFLNIKQLDKGRIMKMELGKAYSNLFDRLFYDEEYDAIIEELTKAMMFLTKIHFKVNTVNRIKFGPEELGRKFWDLINESKQKKFVK